MTHFQIFMQVITGLLIAFWVPFFIWFIRTSKRKEQPQPARVIEYYPSVNAVDDHEIEDILVLDNDQIIISYLPDFQY